MKVIGKTSIKHTFIVQDEVGLHSFDLGNAALFWAICGKRNLWIDGMDPFVNDCFQLTTDKTHGL